MITIVPVKGSNLYLLQEFIENIKEAATTFRYFLKRDITVVKHHLITLLMVEDNVAIAYGHLENENNDIWLGICVRPGYEGQGLGKKMLEALILNAVELNIEKVSLTVDKTNLNAIKLYNKFDFNMVEEADTFYKFEKAISV